MRTTSFLLLLAGMFALPICTSGAEPKSEIKDAIKKLETQPGYSWTYTPKTTGSETAGRQGPIQGKAEKDGITWLKGTSGETSFEAAAKGSKYAVNYNGEWVVVAEDDEETAGIARRLKAVKNPLETAAELVGKSGDLKKEPAGLYSGDLTPEGALDLFHRLGRRAAEAKEAKGSVKFWIKDGMLAKYEFKLQGTITVGTDKKEVDLSRTVTVEIQDVGATKLTLPEEARKKLL